MIDGSPFRVILDKIEQEKQLANIGKQGIVRGMGTELAKVSQLTYGKDEPKQAPAMPNTGLKKGWGGG